MIENNDKLKNCGGTYHFTCPEAGSKRSKNGFSGIKSDIWALGVTFFAFTFRTVPFDGNNLFEIIENIENQEFLNQIFMNEFKYLGLFFPTLGRLLHNLKIYS
jgi:serine/threonine protein kinase